MEQTPKIIGKIHSELKKGENTIMLAVSETFGGWGVMGKWENMEGIQIKD